MKNAERIIGIDILKIVSMLMVVVLHVLSQGGIMDNTVPFSKQYYISNLLEIASYCAVNCYALASGYTMLHIKFNYSRIIFLTLEVIFYNIGITLFFICFFPEFLVPRHLFLMISPLSHGSYWYFIAYLAMYFFMPAMNFIIENMEQSQIKNITFGIIFLFSFYPWLVQKDLFVINNGYSVIWLCSLYIVGAYIRKYGTLCKWGGGIGRIFSKCCGCCNL